MKSHTSSGPDNVKIRSLKITDCAAVLSSLFSLLSLWNYIPRKMKEARNILIFKSGDPNITCNWRPISICSVIRRLFERTFIRRLRKFIRPCEVLSGHGGITGTHVNTTIINGALQRAAKKNPDISIAFLDIEKAYDMVGHDHIHATINALPIPTGIKATLKNFYGWKQYIFDG
jgi:hypothetical protein